MTEDAYIIAIMVLLPVTAGMVIAQRNPYHALVVRGILGAVAALVYALVGAADVALTEALVGTMLSITLYAVAVRSSMNLQVGVLQSEADMSDSPVTAARLQTTLHKVLAPYHLRLELSYYPDHESLTAALNAKVIHTICMLSPQSSPESAKYQFQTRVPRLYDIMQTALSPDCVQFRDIDLEHQSQPAEYHPTPTVSQYPMEEQP